MAKLVDARDFLSLEVSGKTETWKHNPSKGNWKTTAELRDHTPIPRDLSVTQELLARMLRELAQGRVDRELLLELMRYDWLSCGHRFLPPSLAARPLSDIRAELRDNLPPSMEGWYGARERSEFLKRGVFLELSARAGKEIGLDREGRAATVGFLPEDPHGSGKRVRVAVPDLPPTRGGV